MIPARAGETLRILVRSPCDRQEIRAQILSALARGLPAMKQAKTRPFGTMTIVANGPSARSAPDAVFRRSETMAINGAIKLFAGRGMAPKYWLALDPQAMVADFLIDAPAETIYLVATQCHAAVFDVLARNKIRTWNFLHPDAADILPFPRVQTGVSATLGALGVARGFLGFRRIETWGWDGCVIDGIDHAAPQGWHRNTRDVVLDGIQYRTTYDWLAEIDEAQKLLRVNSTLPNGAIHLRVNGAGLMGAALRHHGLAERV